MPLIEIHRHFGDRDAENHRRVTDRTLSAMTRQLENLMINTQRILASVAKQKTETDSLRALVASVKTQLTTTKEELRAAIAAMDPAALAQAQKDIDDAAALLDTDDQQVADALAENVDPSAPPAGDQPSSG
jgi:Skp family chaperone for outer membrane proteins